MSEVERVLTVLRHAKSDWPAGVPDDQRPLNDRGRADAPVAGGWLADNVDGFDLVLCSPAERARQTWELVSERPVRADEVRYDERIYDATTGDLLNLVQGLPDAARSVLVIGHNPGLSYLVTVLSGTPCELKTACVAVLGWTGEWSEAGPECAELLAAAQPRA